MRKKTNKRVRKGPLKTGSGAPQKEKAQVLPVALIMGGALLIFALAMVSMLSNTIKLSNKVNGGTNATLKGDGVIQKGINILTQGNNWGPAPSLALTPIVGYKADRVYLDIPDAQYLVQVDQGNLLSPPGDQAYERTVTVDLYQMQKNYPTPSAQPTPWLRGGAPPNQFVSHRILQAVVRRGSVAAALVAGGSININGHWRVFWGDVYDYANAGGATVVTVNLDNSQPLGPGYPAFHTQTGCISSSGSCAGCTGTGSGSGSTFCNTTDTGAANCKMYPNDPNMPPQPSVGLDGMRDRAMKPYSPGGVPSYETGYFYYATTITPNDTPGINSQTGPAGTGQEHFHQYNASTPFSVSTNGGGAVDQVDNVLSRMAQNMGVTSTWRGADDLYFFIDTTDTKALANDLSNMVIGTLNGGQSGWVDGKDATFRGTFILQGCWGANGHNGSIDTLMSPPSSAWCPAALTAQPDMNGFFYIGGNFDCAGAPIYYGCVYVNGNCSGAGTPTLYYRNDFNYSLIESGTLGVTKWQEVNKVPTVLN
jgi:hypothetical protein